MSDGPGDRRGHTGHLGHRRPLILVVAGLLFAALLAALWIGFQGRVSVPHGRDDMPVTARRGEKALPGWMDASPTMAERLREIQRQLAPARLNYRRPSRLAVGERTSVQVGIVPLLHLDAPTADRHLAEALGVESRALRQMTVDTSTTLIATLVGGDDAFRIHPLHPRDRQILAPERPTQWSWEVTALRPGVHDLTLTLFAVVNAAGREEGLTQTYRDAIRVRIDPVITGAYLIERYWLPVLLTLLAGILGLGSGVAHRLWFRQQRRALQAAMAVAEPRLGQGYLFVSYARHDERFAIPLARDLMLKGVRIWLDQREIKVGEDWMAHIARGIAQTDALLVVLSPRAVASRYVRQEIALGLSLGKPVFPVFYRPCRPPPPLQRLHAIDFSRDYETGLARLVSDIGARGFLRGACA